MGTLRERKRLRQIDACSAHDTGRYRTIRYDTVQPYRPACAGTRSFIIESLPHQYELSTACGGAYRQHTRQHTDRKKLGLETWTGHNVNWPASARHRVASTGTPPCRARCQCHEYRPRDPFHEAIVPACRAKGEARVFTLIKHTDYIARPRITDDLFVQHS